MGRMVRSSPEAFFAGPALFESGGDPQPTRRNAVRATLTRRSPAGEYRCFSP
jgi:hypothetical protein